MPQEERNISIPESIGIVLEFQYLKHDLFQGGEPLLTYLSYYLPINLILPNIFLLVLDLCSSSSCVSGPSFLSKATIKPQ